MPVAASASERGRGELGAHALLEVRVRDRGVRVRDPVGSKCRESKIALVVLRYP